MQTDRQSTAAMYYHQLLLWAILGLAVAHHVHAHAHAHGPHPTRAAKLDRVHAPVTAPPKATSTKHKSTLHFSKTSSSKDTLPAKASSLFVFSNAAPAPSAFAAHPSYQLRTYFNDNGVLQPILSFLPNGSQYFFPLDNQAFLDVSSTKFKVASDYYSIELLPNRHISVNTRYGTLISTAPVGGGSARSARPRRYFDTARIPKNKPARPQQHARRTAPGTALLELDFTPIGFDGNPGYRYFASEDPALLCYQFTCPEDGTVAFLPTSPKPHPMHSADGNVYAATCEYFVDQDASACKGAYNEVRDYFAQGLPSHACDIKTILSEISVGAVIAGLTKSAAKAAVPIVGDALLAFSVGSNIGCGIQAAFNEAQPGVQPDLGFLEFDIVHTQCSFESAGSTTQTITSVDTPRATVSASASVAIGQSDPRCGEKQAKLM